MSVIVFSHIGTRDIREPGQQLPTPKEQEPVTERPKQETVRERGKRLLETYKMVKTSLSYPILQPCIDHILAEIDHIDSLFLLGTDQDDPRYNHTDTIHLAEVITLAFRERYPHQILRVEPVPIKGINPALYDETITYYHERLLELAPEPITRVYMLPTAGTTACSTALLLQGLFLFGERCQVIYQSESKGKPWVLPVWRQMQLTLRQQTAVHLLQRFDFPAAFNVLQEVGYHNDLVMHMLQYASSRLWFEFSEAERYLQAAIDQARGETRSQLATMQTELQALAAQESAALLGELYHNARIAWDNGRYIDFLGRIHRFQQVALERAVQMAPADTFLLDVNLSSLKMETEYRRSILAQLSKTAHSHQEADYTLTQPQRVQLVHNLTTFYDLGELRDLCFELAVHYQNLSSDTLNGKALALVEYSTRHNLLAQLVGLCRQQRPHAAWWDEQESVGELGWMPLVIPALQRLEALRPLYEQSIIANGFGGVSAATIAQKYANTTVDSHSLHDDLPPLRDMVVICAGVGIATENPFRTVRDMITDYLK
ncbi:MAG: hypothetical protein KF770_15640 [Anaerolineae bacterium]|nr:hypothetical protein [Anaerolineae bacterium]